MSVAYDETADQPSAARVVAPLCYRQTGLFPRWRLRLTMLGLLAMPVISRLWGQDDVAAWSFLPGVVATFLGLALRLWAAGWLRKNESLMTSGPYRFARHPLYLGTGLLAVGHGLMSGVPLAPLVVAGLWLALYWPAIREEEQFLLSRYGKAYRDYCHRVPALLGWPHAAPGSEEGDVFSWRQVASNREYEAVMLNGVAILVYWCLSAAR